MRESSHNSNGATIKDTGVDAARTNPFNMPQDKVFSGQNCKRQSSNNRYQNLAHDLADLLPGHGVKHANKWDWTGCKTERC
jgi:hypothetical protein